jgi:Flp pilus assembly protein TadG
MKRFTKSRFVRQTKGAAIIEFALVVPILFMMVWGIISFSRAYQRMNALTASLREGARTASTMSALVSNAANRTLVKTTIRNFSSAFGYPVDTALVTVDASATTEVRVSVTNYPLFSGISFLGNLSSIRITRSAIFRCERDCGT